jgi:hypothetical protein
MQTAAANKMPVHQGIRRLGMALRPDRRPGNERFTALERHTATHLKRVKTYACPPVHPISTLDFAKAPRRNTIWSRFDIECLRTP